jgi:putative membrane-bound dehydrogenase-like protein
MKRISLSLHPRPAFGLCLLLVLPFVQSAAADQLKIDGNRLTYLDDPGNPFYPYAAFPKLTTPQWIGEAGVEAVVVLAIDDMSDPAKYETFLRPILDRLKQIDGRAPLSIMTCSVNPTNAQLQSWLKEGLSMEVHTLTHPCPLLSGGKFEPANNTVHACIDLISQIPNNHPVAFRMPCCDSINSLSPRFFAEIFNHPTANDNFLQMDSSVFNITTTNDPALPREWTIDPDGQEKFRKYLPFPAYSATIDDYPYPYVIGNLCWEFPCAVPSDWEAQNLHQANNPQTVADWKTLLDVIVRKQGVFNFVFHPHGWIRNDQIVELIDYAIAKYGKKVKFLSFREAAERLTKNLLSGQPLRAQDGQDNGVRLVDVNNNGYLDVLIANDAARKTRIWNDGTKQWLESSFPLDLRAHGQGIVFGVVQSNGFASVLTRNETIAGGWNFDGSHWIADKNLLNGLQDNGAPLLTSKGNISRGVRLRDIDHDGICEVIVGNESQNAIFAWSPEKNAWEKLPFALPEGTIMADKEGHDAGLRFVDLNGDGFEDIVFSNPAAFSVHLFNNQDFVGLPRGWSTIVKSGHRGDPGEIPMIVRGGPHPNNGAWFRNGQLWVQNEDTDKMPNIVERRSFQDLIALSADPAKSPRDSLACLKTHPGFKVELLASEPLIESPVAFEWGADGKLWVVEMIDYPQGLNGKGASKVRCLEDNHGDGKYDKSTVFLDGLSFPNGIYPWKKGVLISVPPDLLYAEDTDGDGKADLKKVLFTGFHPGNPQHRANGFDFGLDNWLYGANGDSGGEITSVLTGKKTDINGRDFRFRPGTGEFESESGMTQFGRHRDDWGNWFGNDNPEWLWHFIYPEHYLARNPHLPVNDNNRILANYPDSKRVFAISEPMERFNDPNGVEHVTSGNSPSPYRDELFGPEFATTVFASEPVHNVVHREILVPDGVTFKSHRAKDDEQSEFLASTDNWFRPTMTKTGPDGALYIADMYRLVIEHPEWISADRQKVIDLRAGADKGRIYRVYPENAALRKIPKLARMTTPELVAALDSPNGWQRDTAQRLLVDAQDPNAAPLLEKLFRASNRPKTRLQVLCALEGLQAINLPLLTAAVQDSDAHVREHAIRISEPFGQQICQGLARHTLPQFEKLAEDPDIRVRFQLAFTLGQWNDPVAGRMLSRIALRDWNDPHIQTAVLSSAIPHVATMFTTVLNSGSTTPPSGLLEKLFALAVALNDTQASAVAINAIATQPNQPGAEWQFNAFAAMLDTLGRRNQSFSAFLKKLGLDSSQLDSVQNLFRQAWAIASNPTEKLPARVAATRLVGRGGPKSESDRKLLGDLLQPQIAPELQQAALANLKQSKESFVPAVLFSNWNGYGPALREQVLAALLTRPQWTDALLQQIEAERIPVTHLGPASQQTLLKHSDEQVRNRAAKLFSSNPDRQKLLQQYRPVAQLKGDPEKGHALFRQNCLPCHRIKDEGNNVGPDLGMMADKPIADLLIAILDPNQAVEARYLNYNIVTKNDRELSGIIATETANSLTLKTIAGVEETILRSDLKEMKSSGLSLMPEGFENLLKPQDMADLIAFLKKK